MKIELSLANVGPVPSFKNNKRAIRLKNGSQMIVTDERTKEWMENVIQNFVYLLSSHTPTTVGVTLTEQQRRSLIVSSLPHDDSRQWIPELHIYCRDVDKGNEGATITIEKI